MLADGGGDLGGAQGDGEVVGIGDAGGGGSAVLNAGERLEKRVCDTLEDGGNAGGSAIEGEVAGDAKVAAQVWPVREHGSVELTEQVADGGEEVGVWIRLLHCALPTLGIVRGTGRVRHAG